MSANNLKDNTSLEQLGDAFSRSSECMNNALNSFEGYLRDVVTSMEEDKRVIENRLREAEEKLNSAREALYRCEASQRYDEESGRYRPSCDAQAMRLSAAQSKYDAYKKIYDDANRILQECNKEIAEYKLEAQSIYTEVSSKSCEAVSRLNVILGKVVDYNDVSVSCGGQTVSYSPKKSPISGYNVQVSPLKKVSGNLCPKHNRPLPCPFCMKDAKDDGIRGSGPSIDTEKKTPTIQRPKSPVLPSNSDNLSSKYYQGLKRPSRLNINEQTQRFNEAQVKLHNHNREKEELEKSLLWEEVMRKRGMNR